MTTHQANDIETVTRRIIEAMTYDGFLFTALDVSNEVKKKLPGVRHREVAPIVRDLFASGVFGPEYKRTLIDVIADGQKKANTFLYHLEDDDPDDYAGTQRQQLATPPIPVQQQKAALADSTKCLIDIGNDGRARIPLAFLMKAGITGPSVQVEQEGPGPKLLLCNPHGSGKTVMATLVFSDPIVLYIPLNLLQAFDVSTPLYAEITGQGVVIG